MENGVDLEIIDFYQPRVDSKNLFITNIFCCGCPCSSETLIEECLYTSCSRFGLLYEIQVFQDQKFKQCNVPEIANIVKDDDQTDSKSCDSCHQSRYGTHRFYAFVKFFSHLSARRAKQFLHLTHFVGTQACRVNFAKRKKLKEEELYPLHTSRCKELINFYLGFNGWSSSVKMLGEDVGELSSQAWGCEIVYTAEIFLPKHDLTSTGLGSCEELINSPNIQGKIQAKSRCHKRALERALQNAFSKILLVILNNGKVFPEIDTTQQEVTHMLYNAEEAAFSLQELETEPESDGEMDGDNSCNITSEMDQANVDILRQLENDTQQ